MQNTLRFEKRRKWKEASETSLKRSFRSLVGVWSEAYETRSGSGFGYPDLQLLINGWLLPVEIKKGWISEGRLHSTQIRPSQIFWHHRFAKSGGTSVIIVCWKDPLLQAWALPACTKDVTSGWKQGWEIEDCEQWIKDKKMVINLSSLVPNTNAL